MNKPNLFIIGAMKSGTTTLHELLDRHPEISMCEPKEPCFFVPPETLRTLWPEMWNLGFWKTDDAYLSLFSEKPKARYHGESSTDYSKQPQVSGVAERIFEFNPTARIIYIMRDPIERTLSHYWHMVEHRGETRTPLDAIAGDPHYMEVSHYAAQLTPYLDRFGRHRVHALTFEELKRDAAGTLCSLYRWLDVDPLAGAQALDEAHNVTPDLVRQKRAHMAFLDRLRHSVLWAEIGRHCPPTVRRLGRSLVERRVVRRDVSVDAAVSYLRPLQRAQTNTLQQLLDRRFDEWKTLWNESK